MIRVYGLEVRNRPAAIALAALVLAVGAVFVAFGIVLLLGLAAIGTLAGTAALLFRSVTGRVARVDRRAAEDLDPTLEVFPPQSGSRLPETSSRTRAHESD